MTYAITQDDFGSRKEHSTYVIKCPGTYKLKENISFRPCMNKGAAILIDSDNVILDLNGKVLRQSKRSHKSQITGVVVKTGHRNVTILGSYGSVTDFSQAGVYVEGGNEYVTIGDATQLTISGCGYGTPVAFVENDKGLVQGGLQLGDQEYLALIGVGKFKGALREVSVQNVVSSANSNGCFIGEGYNYEFNNCSFSSNVDTRLVWEKIVNLGGFYVTDSTVCYGMAYFSNPEVTKVGINNIVIADCKFNLNLADGAAKNTAGAYCNGLLLTATFKNLRVNRSQFDLNKSTLASGSGSKGLLNETLGLVIGAGSGTVVEDSTFSGNEGGSEVVGCSFSGLAPPVAGAVPGKIATPSESTTVRRCVASRNVGSTSSTVQKVDVRGFSLKFPSGATLIECVAEDNKAVLFDANKDSVPGFCDGIFIFADPQYPLVVTNNVEVRGCKLSRNRVVNAGRGGGTSSGVRVFDDICENIVIRDCVISNNSPDADESFGEFVFTTGVDLFNEGGKTGASYVTVADNVIQSNGRSGVESNLDVTNVQNNKITNHAYGVFLSGVELEDQGALYLIGGANGSVTDNKFVDNLTTVIDVNNGSVVLPPNPPGFPLYSTNLVAGNTSYNSPNGYQVVYQGGVPVSVSSSVLPDFPAYPPASVWTNVLINQGLLNQPLNQAKLSANKVTGSKFGPKVIKVGSKVTGSKVESKVDHKKYFAAKKALMAKRRA